MNDEVQQVVPPPLSSAEAPAGDGGLVRHGLASTRPPFITAEAYDSFAEKAGRKSLQRGRRSSRRKRAGDQAPFDEGALLQRGRRSSRRKRRIQRPRREVRRRFNEAAVHHGGSVSPDEANANLQQELQRGRRSSRRKRSDLLSGEPAARVLQRGRRSSRRRALIPTRSPWAAARASTRPPFITAESALPRTPRAVVLQRGRRSSRRRAVGGRIRPPHRSRASTRPPFITAESRGSRSPPAR